MLTFTADRNTFAQAVAWAARSLPTKPLTPIWAGIKLEAPVGTGITMSAFDSEVSAQVHVDTTSSGNPIGASSVVSGRLLAAIAKVLPQKPVEFRHEGSLARVTAGTTEFTLPTMLSAEFPKLPNMPADVGTVDASTFADAVARVVVAASHDEAVHHLTAVQLKLADGRLRLAASDRYRMALLDMPWEAGDAAPGEILVPSKSLTDVGRLGDGDVTLAFDENVGVFGVHGGGRRITTRVIDAEFPNLWRAIPADDKITTRAQIVVRDIVEAVSRVLVVVNDLEKQRLHVRWAGDGLHLTAGSDGIGRMSEVVPVDVDGPALEQWVNPKYFLDGLNALPTDKAEVQMSGWDRPLVMRPDVDGYIHAVMPTKAPPGMAL